MRTLRQAWLALTGAGSRRGDLLALAGLFLAPWVFYWRLFAPGELRRYFEGGDFVDQFLAFTAHEVRAFAAGEVPLWNPYAYAGTPFWADVQAAVAYPFSLANVLIQAALGLDLLRLLAALQTEAVLHGSLAGCFTYLFARRLWRSRGAGLVAALTFAWGGYLSGYPPLQLAILETAVWLPLALLGVDLTLEGEGRRDWWGPVLLALALGLATLAGHPQTALHLLYATAAWAAFRAWPWKSGGWRPWARLGLGALLGLGLSAATWLPAAQFLRLSNRAEAHYALLANGFPPAELLGAFLPGITKWAPLYIGVLSLLLALVAAADALRPVAGGTGAAGGAGGAGGDSPEAPSGAMPSSAPSDPQGASRRLARFWLALGLVALFLSLGSHAFAFDLFYLLAPGFDLFRGQERAALLVSFSLALLAGRGAVLWLGADGAARRLVANGALALAVLGALLILVARPELRGAALHLLLSAGAVAGLAAAMAGGRVGARWALLASLVLLGLDLYLANADLNLVPRPPAELSAAPPVSTLGAAAAQRIQIDARLHEVESLRPNVGVLHGLEMVSGASPLRLRSFEALSTVAQVDEGRWWDLLGVSHVVTERQDLPRPADLVETVPKTTDHGVPLPAHLYRLPQHGPLVWRATAAEGPLRDAEALTRLADPELEPSTTVLLATGAGGEPAPGRAGVGLTAWRSGFLEAETYGEGPGWLVFATSPYPGWRAAVDGKPAEVLRANVGLMAVAVPAGQHRVRLWFRAPLATAGLGLSLLAALALIVLTAAGLRRGQSPGQGLKHRPEA